MELVSFEPSCFTSSNILWESSESTLFAVEGELTTEDVIDVCERRIARLTASFLFGVRTMYDFAPEA